MIKFKIHENFFFLYGEMVPAVLNLFLVLLTGETLDLLGEVPAVGVLPLTFDSLGPAPYAWLLLGEADIGEPGSWRSGNLDVFNFLPSMSWKTTHSRLSLLFIMYVTSFFCDYLWVLGTYSSNLWWPPPTLIIGIPAFSSQFCLFGPIK